MRVGVIGGTFDPPHRGHLHAAREAQGALELDRVLFVPCQRQPLKEGRPAASGYHRAAMVALAIARRPDWALELAELDRGGPSYTIETLEALRADRPGDRLFLILGEDSYRSLERWHRWRDIVAATPLVVVPRPGWEEAPSAPAPAGAEVHRVRARPDRCSSSVIRERLAAGEDVRRWVPAPGVAYILRQGLSGAGSSPGAHGR